MVSGYNSNSLRLIKLPITPDLASRTPMVRINLTGEQDSLIVHNKRIKEEMMHWTNSESESESSSDSNSRENTRVLRRYKLFSISDELIRKIEAEGFETNKETLPPTGELLLISWNKELISERNGRRVYQQIEFSLEITPSLQMVIISSVETPMDIFRQIEVTKHFAASLLRFGAELISTSLVNSGKPLAALNRTLRGVRNSSASRVMNNPNLARIVRSHLRNTGRNYNGRRRNLNLGNLKNRFTNVKRILSSFESRMQTQTPYYDNFLNSVVFE